MGPDFNRKPFFWGVRGPQPAPPVLAEGLFWVFWGAKKGLFLGAHQKSPASDGRSSASKIVSLIPRHASVTRCRRKSLATFLGSTQKKSARPTSRPPAAEKTFRRLPKYVHFCRREMNLGRYTQARHRTSGNKTKHSRRSPAPVSAKSTSAKRRCGSSASRRSLAALSDKPVLNSAAQTPSGQTSAFPDTPRDSLHVTRATRGVRKDFSEACGRLTRVRSFRQATALRFSTPDTRRQTHCRLHVTPTTRSNRKKIFATAEFRSLAARSTPDGLTDRACEVRTSASSVESSRVRRAECLKPSSLPRRVRALVPSVSWDEGSADVEVGASTFDNRSSSFDPAER